MAVNPDVRRQFYKSFEAKALKSRSFLTRFSDDLTSIFGSTAFLIINAILFSTWVVINLGLTSIKPFDPFPFGLLTMIVSLEAIFLSIFVLVSQNRSSYVDTLREDLHMQINIIAEEEITKALEVLSDIRKKVGITKDDPRLDQMVKRINTNYIEKSLITQMEKANPPLFKNLVKEFPELINPMNISDKVSHAISTEETKILSTKK